MLFGAEASTARDSTGDEADVSGFTGVKFPVNECNAPDEALAIAEHVAFVDSTLEEAEWVACIEFHLVAFTTLSINRRS